MIGHIHDLELILGHHMLDNVMPQVDLLAALGAVSPSIHETSGFIGILDTDCAILHQSGVNTQRFGPQVGVGQRFPCLYIPPVQSTVT